MYKILTKLHTATENIYAMHAVEDADGNMIEYTAETGEEAAEVALALLGKIGYEDLRIVDDQSYYLELIYGQKPEPPVEKYTINLITPDGVTCEPTIITDIEYGHNANTNVGFVTPPVSFHLIVDGEETLDGLPEWITYENITNTVGVLYFSNITANHNIEIVVDTISA